MQKIAVGPNGSEKTRKNNGRERLPLNSSAPGGGIEKTD